MGFARNTIAALMLAGSASGQAIAPGMLDSLEWRSVGPAATGGRIADLAVSKVPGEPTEIFVATTTGGVFKSANEGVSWTPVFDRAGGSMSIGAIAVAPSNHSVVWVGTGEADNRQSSSWGDGVYRSLDGGRSWQKMGLEETRHIGRILIHPTDPNTVWVAAVGHLWGSNSERGVYKTTDGGKTWKKVLYRDEHTGAIDLAMDPKDPDVVFAAMYQRQRKGWGFNGGGPGSGIFRTGDGGANWKELTNGLPAGDKGRIGLGVFAGDSRVVYAIVEGDGGGGGRGGDGESAGAPAAGRGGRNGPAAAASLRGGVFRSLDQGETWEHLSGLNPRPMYYSRIYVDPRDANRVYLMGSNRGLYVSDDAGRNFRDVFSGVHGEDHVLWIDPENSNRLVIGGDGGVSISYDRGATWLFRINLPIGQFYNISTSISTNSADPFLVCGGLQDNGSWCTPTGTNYGYGVSFKEAFNVGGGDGMNAVFDGDDRTVLVSSQNGTTQRLDLLTMERQSIGPVQPEQRPKPGDPAYRWYWTTPLIVSAFSPDTIYTGANVLFRSDDRGVTWKAISSDLTGQVDREKLEMMGGRVPSNALSRHDGQTNFSALTVIAESPMDRNVLYTGADDGTIQMTRDGGQHWTDLTGNVKGLPPGLSISGIAASKHSAGRVYVTVDGHFNDDYHAYIFESENFGRTWRALTEGLPRNSVHRLREHPTNPNFLVAGTENGVFGSFDRGAHWTALAGNLPPVPVYDLVFQEKSGALVAGTHGRGIWVLDHADTLAHVTKEVLTGNPHIFPAAPVYHFVIYPGQFWFGAGEYFAPNPPFGAVLDYYLPKATNDVQIAIADSEGKTIRLLRGPGRAGLNRTCWDLRRMPPTGDGGPQMGSCLAVGASLFGGRGAGIGPVVEPGKYSVTLTAAGAVTTTEVTVSANPRWTFSDADRKQRRTAISSAYELLQQLVPSRDTVQRLSGQVSAIRQYLAAAGENGSAGVAAVDAVSAQIVKAQAQVLRAMTEAGSALSAIDGFDGLPTAAQLRQLQWAWEDATAGATALNQVIREEMPAVYSAVGGTVRWPEVRPVMVPSHE